MRANENTILHGPRVVLVPYRKEHVLTYHAWMQDPFLREMTASEELGLEEEMQMQQRWHLDDDKLTFIVLARTSPDGVPASSTTDIRSADAAHPDGTYHLEPLPEDVAALPMIGDVNLFLKGTPPATPWVPDTTEDLADEGVPGRSELQNTKDDDPPFEAEVEVMIAEPAFRQKGYAYEVLQIFLTYVTGCDAGTFCSPHCMVDKAPTIPGAQPLLALPHPIAPSMLVARISKTNKASVRLFEKLGFVIAREVPVWGEVEMRWRAHCAQTAGRRAIA